MSESATLPVGTQLARLAAQDPDAPALTCGDRTATRAELDRASNRLARAYRQLGVGPGSYVTIMLPNSIEWFEAAFAIWKLGAIVQPLSGRLPGPELDALLDLVPRALLVGTAERRGIPAVPSGFVPSPELSDAPLEDVFPPALKAMPSGGSTGRPKLIESTDEGRMDPSGTQAMFDLRADDIQLITGPLTHNSPLALALAGLLLGQHVVLMKRFDAAECLRLIAEYRVSWMVTVPTVLQRLLPVLRADPGAHDLSSLRALWHLAAPCPPAVKEAWIDLLGPDAVWELYGGTELVAMTFISGTQWLSHRGSVGKVLVGRMKILDDEGRECPPGVVGEIYMHPGEGAGPTYRYLGSESVLRDGWDTIGDLGWFDEEGFLYLSDRRTDLFNVGGRKVYPAEIEGVLSGHPEVLSCLVVGLPDDDLGQVPHAVVERAPGSTLDEDGIRAFVAAQLAGYKVPREIEFSAEPLRDDAGKARRSAVRERLIAERAARQSA